MFIARRMPEMVVSDLVQGRRGRITRYMAAKFRVLAVRLDHHRHGVPTVDRSDPPFQRRIAWCVLLLVRRDRIDISGIGGVGKIGAGAPRLVDQAFQQIMSSIEPFDLDERRQRLEPFVGFLRVYI